MSFIFRRSQEDTTDSPKEDLAIDDSADVSEVLSPPPRHVEKRSSFLGRLMSGARTPSPSPKSGEIQATSSTNSINSLPPLPPLNLVGYKNSTKHRLLDEELAGNIRNLVPARLQLFDEWTLVYSLEQHGISINTLYRNCDPEYQLQQLKKKRVDKGYGDAIIRNMVVGASGPYNSYETKRPQGYVLIVKDEKNSKFGCYLNENLKIMDHKRYYGNGECFLWKCETYDPQLLSHNSNPNLIDFDSESTPSSPSSRTATRFKAYPYTGINDNIIYSNHNFISVGSSNGQNGLYIDKSLYKGVSCGCETFGNEILNTSDPGARIGRFKIMGLEVWRIGTLE